MERKFSWLAFPGLIRSIALLQAVFFVVLFLNPDAASAVAPNWELVMQGEVWRLVGFVFFPPVSPNAMGPVFGALFMFFAVNILFLMNDALEGEWGEFHVSLYVYATIICQSFSYHFFPTYPLFVFYSAIFFPFATLFPHVEFRFMLFIPVKVWLLAAFSGILYFLASIGSSITFLATVVCFLPYLVWAIPLAFKWRKNRGQVSKRRAHFESHKTETDFSLHRCHTCQKTETSDPELEFRVSEDGEEYCLDHLPTHPKSNS